MVVVTFVHVGTSIRTLVAPLNVMTVLVVESPCAEEMVNCETAEAHSTVALDNDIQAAECTVMLVVVAA